MNNEKKSIEGTATPNVKATEQQSKAKDDASFEPLHVRRGFAVTVITIFLAFLILPTIAWGVLSIVNATNPTIMETLNFVI